MISAAWDADVSIKAEVPAPNVGIAVVIPCYREKAHILDVLARYRAHATFFEIGSHVDEYPELARRILAAGNEIGQHTFTHANLSAAPGWRRSMELTLAGNAIAAATGRAPVLFRPPYSAEPDAVARIVARKQS